MKTKISTFLGILIAICAFSINSISSEPWADEWAVFFQGCIYALESSVITFGVTYVALYVWENFAPHRYEKFMKKLSSKVEEIANSAFDE